LLLYSRNALAMESTANRKKMRASHSEPTNDALERPNDEYRTIYHNTPFATYSSALEEPPPMSKLFKSMKRKIMENRAKDISRYDLIRFYDPNARAKDIYGRTLDSILAYDDRTLEMSHNYIQWIFPLPEGSLFTDDCPLVGRKELEAFRNRPDLQNRLRLSFIRMLGFYGFRIKVSDDPSPAPNPPNIRISEPESRNEGEQAAPATRLNLVLPDPDEPPSPSLPTVGFGEARPNLNPCDTDMEILPMDAKRGESNVDESTGHTTATTRAETKEGTDPSIPIPSTTAFGQPERSAKGKGKAAATEESSDQLGPLPNISTSGPGPSRAKGKEKVAGSATEAQDDNPPAQVPPIKVMGMPDFELGKGHWAKSPRDHNHLRITRILRSLRLLGLEQEAQAFLSALEILYMHSSVRISSDSMDFWRIAVRGPLHTPPYGSPIPWLQRWLEEHGIGDDEEGEQDMPK
jgi:hypothetical protein